MVTPASFTVEFPDPISGVRRTITMYAGDKKMTAFKYDTSTDTIFYQALDFNLIQF